MPDIRVRIRGTGVVSCFGIGVAPLVQALRAGRVGVTPLTLFPLPFQHEIQVNEIDRTPFPDGEEGMAAMALVAIDEALADAGRGADSLRDAALLVGTSNLLFAAEAQQRKFVADPAHAAAPALRPPGFLATHLAQRLGARGRVCALSTACSSSANALLVARDLIARGAVKRALVVGIEGLSAIAVSGFYSLMLLDPAGCRPFDTNRRGLQLGEGVAALLLEADSDGDAWLAGGANRCDIHHVTSAQPDGVAMRAVMADALAQAGITPDAVTIIKAHGTGSPDNDAAEVAAMRGLFGDTLPPFTGLKRYFGHTLGACGALEVAALLAGLRAGFVPATAGFAEPDPGLGAAPLVQTLPASPGDYLCNFFGFGGNYCSLVLRHG